MATDREGIGDRLQTRIPASPARYCRNNRVRLTRPAASGASRRSAANLAPAVSTGSRPILAPSPTLQVETRKAFRPLRGLIFRSPIRGPSVDVLVRRRGLGRPMNTKHTQDHLDSIFLYALQALPSAEVRVVEAQLSVCTDCRQELEALRPVVGFFVSWPTDVLRPPACLWERLAHRIAEESGSEPMSAAPQRRVEAEWEEVEKLLREARLKEMLEKEIAKPTGKLASTAARPNITSRASAWCRSPGTKKTRC